jgi:hypothetical protein
VRVVAGMIGWLTLCGHCTSLHRAGVGVVLLPQFVFGNPKANSDDNIPLFNIIFLGAVLPSVSSAELSSLGLLLR